MEITGGWRMYESEKSCMNTLFHHPDQYPIALVVTSAPAQLNTVMC